MSAPNVYGLEMADLPEGWTPLSAVVIVKALNEDGRPVWASRISEDLTSVEALGMLQMVEAWTLDDLRDAQEGDDR
jgi:hypothetical protein